MVEAKDISIKPKRFQQDIEPIKEENAEEVKNTYEIPKNITVETAIKYFESAAEGEIETLYKRTAGWLKLLLSSQNKNTTIKSRESVQDIIIKKRDEKNRIDIFDGENDSEK